MQISDAELSVIEKGFERLRHRFHHRLGRTVRILVVRQLGERIVFLETRAARRLGARRAAALRQKVRRADFERPDRGRDRSDKTAAGHSVLHIHRSLRSVRLEADFTLSILRANALMSRAAVYGAQSL